jgi:hypothetical protein
MEAAAVAAEGDAIEAVMAATAGAEVASVAEVVPEAADLRFLVAGPAAATEEWWAAACSCLCCCMRRRLSALCCLRTSAEEADADAVRFLFFPLAMVALAEGTMLLRIDMKQNV